MRVLSSIFDLLLASMTLCSSRMTATYNDDSRRLETSKNKELQ
jgi:hypothetical protein